MQPNPLAEAGNARHADIVRRTESAITDLQASGERISFYAVADKAQISRSTLYRCDDLRQLVEAARKGNAILSTAVPSDTDPQVTALKEELARVLHERDFLRTAVRNTPRVEYALVCA